MCTSSVETQTQREAPKAASAAGPSEHPDLAATAEALLLRVLGHSRFAAALADRAAGAALPPAAVRLQTPLESLLPMVEDECWAQQVQRGAAHVAPSCAIAEVSLARLTQHRVRVMPAERLWPPLALVCSLAGMSVAPPPEVGSVARSGQRVQAWRAGRLRKRHDVAGQCGCPVAGGAPVTSPNSPQPVQRSLALEAPCAHTRPGPAPSARACLITACYAVP